MLIDVMCCAYAAGCVMDFMFGVRSEFGGAKFAEVFSKTPPFGALSFGAVCCTSANFGDHTSNQHTGRIFSNFPAENRRRALVLLCGLSR